MKSRDLTKGKISSNLWYMAIPAMLGMLAHSLNDVVDMMWIGRISASSLAAITLFSSIYWLVAVFNNVIGSGSVAVLSQAFGAGNIEEARKTTAGVFAFKLMAGIAAAIVLYLIIDPLLHVYSNDLHVIGDALSYGRIRIIFMPIMFSSFTVTTALRCSGDSKSPMYITLFTAIINMVLDPILIFKTIPFIGLPGFGLGVFGAALATVIATTLSFALGFYLMFGPRSKMSINARELVNIDFALAKRVTKIGLPQASSNFLNNLANVIMIGLISGYGTIALAAWGISGRLFGLLLMPINGLTEGGSAITGQSIGAGKVDRAENAAKLTSKIGVGIMSIVAVLSFAFSRQVVGLFSADPQVIIYAADCLRAVMLCLPFYAHAMGLATLFVGSGYTIPFLVGGILAQWGLMLPAMFIFTKVLSLPFKYVPLSYLGLGFGFFFVFIYYYRKGKWRNYALKSYSEQASVAD